MNEFDYEVLQRKRLANQAKHRKRGSRSKKCSLSTDGMSRKKWEERNGEVMSYNLNKPMDWKQFKAMPLDLQKQYCEKLRDEYGATGKAVADMLGIAKATFSLYLRNNDIAVFPHSGGARKLTLFQQFLEGGNETEQEAALPDAPVGAEPENEAEPYCNPTECDCGEQKAIEPPRKPSMLLDSFTLQFSGEFDPDAVRNSLALILQRGQRVSIQISCTVEG